MLDARPDAEAPGASESRVQRWERRTEWPLAALALLFLIAYAWPILISPLHDPWARVCRDTDLTVWILFIVDYATRMALAEHRMRYWSRHLPDLAVIALPVLRPLRLLRLLMLLRVLNRRASNSLRGKVIIYVTGAAVLLVLCASLAVLDAERNAAGANIKTIGDALWWAVATVSTVGYGDRYPVTTEGRFVAVGLMIGGIALIGVVTASFATWLIDRVRDVEEGAQAATRHDFAELVEQIRALEARLSTLPVTGPESTP